PHQLLRAFSRMLQLGHGWMVLGAPHRHEVHDDRRHVAIARADHAQKNAHPDAVDRKDDKRRYDEEHGPPDWHAEDHQHHRNDDHVVRQNDQVAVYRAPSVNRVRHAHLRDDVTRGEEGLAPLVDHRRYKIPDHQPDRQKRQISADLHVEHAGVDYPHGSDHD